MYEIGQLLDQALIDVANGHYRGRGTKLTTFFPAKGKKATGELMIVGRAPNGWLKGWLPETFSDSKDREAIIRCVMNPPWAPAGTCPMLWISQDWSRGGFVCGECYASYEIKTNPCTRCGETKVQERYNPAKSAFYRVMRSVTEALDITNPNDDEWSSHLIYSNLYKVAPTREKNPNPSEGLVKAQQNACVRMLGEEIVKWTPRRLLFLTGLDWAAPFLAGIGVAAHPSHLDRWVSYVGTISSRLEGTQTSVVVGPHPQCKPEREIVRQVVQAFSLLREQHVTE